MVKKLSEKLHKVYESDVQSDIQKALEEQVGGFWWKTVGGKYQRTGLPDRVGVVQGYFIGIEVKVPGKENTLTTIQAATLQRINKNGGLGFMSSSPEHSVEVVKAWLTDKRRGK